jgi:hypothetical protein
VVENTDLRVGGRIELPVNVYDLFHAGDPHPHLVLGVRDIAFVYTEPSNVYRNRCPVKRSNREI